MDLQRLSYFVLLSAIALYLCSTCAIGQNQTNGGVNCTKDNDCSDGKICNIGICTCPDGYEGKICEDITGCKNLKETCAEEDAECIFKKDAPGMATCKCNKAKFSYDFEDKKCKEQCSEDGDDKSCKNSGLCLTVGSHKLCNCSEGLAGDFCEIITDCNSKYKYCKGDNGTCEFENGEAVCKCTKRDTVFNPTAGYCSENFCKSICGTSKDTICKGNAYDKDAVQCSCKDIEKVFTSKRGGCKKQCSEDNEKCQNNGQCTKSRSFKLCKCLKGTGGDFCEILTDCNSKLKYCKGDNGTCVFEGGKTICKCTKESTVFNPEVGFCSETCSINSKCKNGGTCNTTISPNTCSCLKGTEGPYCQEVQGCKTLDCGSEAKCMFDVLSKSAVCKCNTENTEYDDKDQKCKENFCKIVCGESEGIECEGKANEKKGVQCKCKEAGKVFVVKEEGCKGQCSEDDGKAKCQNGGQCVSSGSIKFCKCPEGTAGDFCESITECNSIYKDCKGDKGTCVFESGKTVCKCTKEITVLNPDVGYCTENFCKMACGELEGVECEGKDYDEAVQCKCKDVGKVFVSKEQGCKGQCSEDVDKTKCQNGGQCVASGSFKLCKCPKGTAGDFCEMLTECNSKYKDCKGDKGTCVFESGKTVCKCTKESTVLNPEVGYCTENFCKIICGELEGVECEGNAYNKEAVQCKCKDVGKVFVGKEQGCQEPCVKDSDCKNGGSCREDGSVRTCSCLEGTAGPFCERLVVCDLLVCGSEAKCQFDAASGSATCKCNVEKLTFDSEDMKCKEICRENPDCKNGGSCKKSGSQKTCSCLKGTGGPFCEKVTLCDKMDCGTDAVCSFDVTSKAAVCECRESDSAFHPESKKCKVNQCKQKCGVDSDAKGPVLCEGEPFGKANVSCKCGEKNMDFLSDTKSCKVNKCKEKCGLSTGKGGKVLCTGEPFGKGEVSCSCKDPAMKYNPDTKKCKKGSKLSSLSIFVIAFSVILVIILTAVLVLYRRKTSSKPRYSMRFRDQTISFESALYDANSGRMSFSEDGRH